MQKVQCNRCRVVHKVGTKRPMNSRCEVPVCTVWYADGFSITQEQFEKTNGQWMPYYGPIRDPIATGKAIKELRDGAQDQPADGR